MKMAMGANQVDQTYGQRQIKLRAQVARDRQKSGYQPGRGTSIWVLSHIIRIFVLNLIFGWKNVKFLLNS